MTEALVDGPPSGRGDDDADFFDRIDALRVLAALAIPIVVTALL